MKYSFGNFVRDTIARYLGLPESCVDPSQRLREDLGLFPLDVVLVALCLEDVARVRFPVERLESAHTVEELTRLLWSCRFTSPIRASEVAECERDVEHRRARGGTHPAHVQEAVDHSGEAPVRRLASGAR